MSDQEAAERAGGTLSQLQNSGTGVKIRDLLVGCIARERAYSLLTFDMKHFQRITGLLVLDASRMS